MSGFEAVGVILGVLPLIISALEHYAQGVSTAKRFWQYKSELKSLLRSIRTEKDIFLNTCETLLTGIVRVDQMSLFLEYPEGQLWHDLEIEEKLEERLKGAYAGYSETVEDMNTVLGKFMEKLKLDPAGKVQFSDPNAFKKEFKRLKFSISRSAYEDLLNKIRQNNVTLSQLTKQSITLESTRAACRRSSPNFRAVQDYAKSVYTILRSSWQCGCQAPHTVSLRLEPRCTTIPASTPSPNLAATNFRRPFTRYDKLRISVILASSVLQLHKTPWVDEKWGKDDILFIDRPSKPLFDHPYVARQFFACKTSQTDQPCSSDGLNPCRVIRNKALFDLGVLLIELWYGQSLEKLRTPADLNTDGIPSLTADWCTADRIVDEILWDAGSRYSEAVRRCIRCDFDRRETNLEDGDFRQAVYDGVVSLLEKNFEQFSCLD
ncbi:hypothetical protein AOQ84DRAFT_424460 [Glonium stellatum]|uniref:DUF7580 domain-containing protein n=1 Tax=Glonium stellatum TaxID=574774 RepID=A0A8E2ENP0_9PEZI|nr:hypothetical protein AOQ84DRAFT_424460 [Glonium stellatum]